MAKLFILFFFLISVSLGAQGPAMASDLEMTFPSIYFKHNSIDYAAMPYTADSCFKYIAQHFDDNINSLVLWRDSTEMESLAIKRISKLKAGLGNYMSTKNITIYSMGREQKILRHTMSLVHDSTQINYLLTLNSVFDFSKSRLPNKTVKLESHILHPKIWCFSCWRNGFHLNKRGRALRKAARQNKKKQAGI